MARMILVGSAGFKVAGELSKCFCGSHDADSYMKVHSIVHTIQ